MRLALRADMLSSFVNSQFLILNSSSKTMTSTTHRIAVVAGDGIGREVTPPALAAAAAAVRPQGVALELVEFPWGCEYYLQTGRMMDADALRAAGRTSTPSISAPSARPTVPDHIVRVGADPADPAAVRSVREPAADASAAGLESPLAGRAARPTST